MAEPCTYDFLEEDLERLDAQMRKIADVIREHGQAMGESCCQSAETYHDNFPYEESVRQHALNCKRLSDLARIRKYANVVRQAGSAADDGGREIGIGSVVTFRDEDSDEHRTIRIGSYLCFNDESGEVRRVSYNAPLAAILLGAREGEVRRGRIAGRERSFIVVSIDT